MALALSQQARACLEWTPLEKLITFNMTCLWCLWTFIQIHSCIGICFLCMYTNNSEHLPR